MLRLDIEIEGAEALQRAFSYIGAQAVEHLALSLVSGAHAVRDDIVYNIQRGDKTGRIYGDHQASAPGEYPATDTGFLVNHIIADDSAKDLGHGLLYVAVQSEAPYSEALEFGTRKMAPRSFMRPSLDSKKDDVVRDVQQALNAALRSARF